MRKSESSMEFILLAVFMLFVLVGFFSLVARKLNQSKEQQTKQIAEDIASYVFNELNRFALLKNIAGKFNDISSDIVYIV